MLFNATISENSSCRSQVVIILSDPGLADCPDTF